MIPFPNGRIDLGEVHILGTDEVDEEGVVALDVPKSVPEGATVYRVLQES